MNASDKSNAKSAHLIIRGLKCDATGCDYFDETAVPDEALIGKPCPKCGASLLADADMANIRLLQWVTLLANSAAGPPKEGAVIGYTRIKMDGTGSIEFGETTTGTT